MKNANLLNDSNKNERPPLCVGLGIAGAVTLAAVLLAVFFVTHPATASDGDNSEASGPSAQSEGLSSALPTQSEDLPSAPPESQPPAQTAPMITTEDPKGAMALEELLDAEQLEVFNAAVDVYRHLFGGDTDEVNYWEGRGPYPYKWETIEIDDMLYTKSWGPYANYADFDVLIHSVFTEQFWAERNEWAGDIKMYINVDGSLYYISAAIGGDDDYNWDVPDTCRLVERTDDTISFTLIGHYSRLYPRENGTYGHTLEFPARMVRTADGWRVDQLYLPRRDRDRLYGWEIQPPTQTEPVVTTEDPEGAMALKELLDAEQLEVFNAAVDVYLHLFGGDTDEVNFWENGRQSPQEWETVEIGGMEYTKSWGPYANYADFDALIRSVFSEQFWEERNDVLSNGLGLFMNVDGALYYISVGGGSGYDYNWDVPDTYRLADRTDDTVTFTIVGHYASIFPREDGTYGHTAEFPVRMVLTEDGWRMDQLYLHGVDYHMLPQSAGLEN